MNGQDAASQAREIMGMHLDCAHGLHGVCRELANGTHLTYDESWERLVAALRAEVARILEEES